MQNQLDAVSHCLGQLQERISQDSLEIIKQREDDAELDFLFPELKRIQGADLVVLNTWQKNTDVLRSLSADEIQFLAGTSSTTQAIADLDANLSQSEDAILSIPPEQLFYEELKQKSHVPSIELQLRLLVAPQLRQKYEGYISEQAEKAGSKAIILANMTNASETTIANLYWYFKKREEQKSDSMQAAVVL